MSKKRLYHNYDENSSEENFVYLLICLYASKIEKLLRGSHFGDYWYCTVRYFKKFYSINIRKTYSLIEIKQSNLKSYRSIFFSVGKVRR